VFGSARRRIAVFSATCAAGAIAHAAIPMTAQAALVNLDLCDHAPLSQPFSQWGDPASYKLAPGADFEGSLAGWTLSAGAARASGSESYGVSGSVGSSSLSLPDGSTAVSPQTCVDAAYPDFRLFTRSDSPGSSVVVSVLFSAPLLGTVTIPVGAVPATSSWEPSPVLLTGSAIPGALHGGTANISLQFSGSGGTVQVDDVYVDPHGRCC
jgi:hypothetical protein